jgi:hypothetical protein
LFLFIFWLVYKKIPLKWITLSSPFYKQVQIIESLFKRLSRSCPNLISL